LRRPSGRHDHGTPCPYHAQRQVPTRHKKWTTDSLLVNPSYIEELDLATATRPTWVEHLRTLSSGRAQDFFASIAYPAAAGFSASVLPGNHVLVPLTVSADIKQPHPHPRCLRSVSNRRTNRSPSSDQRPNARESPALPRMTSARCRAGRSQRPRERRPSEDRFIMSGIQVRSLA